MRRVRMILAVATAAAFLQAATGNAAAADAAFDTELAAITQAWDHANFESTTADEKRAALESLSQRAAGFTQRYPNRAEPLIWEGIVLSTYAGAKGGFGALGLAKRSRERLLAALQIDPSALNGSAYTSLGALYYKVPGFPIGFGDHGKAREYLHKALEISPDGMDPNYFYGELMTEEGEYSQALQYLQKAQAAPSRVNRPVADTGRRQEIAALIQRVRAKHG